MPILKKFWIIAGLTLFLAGVGWGDEYTWKGAISDDWADPNNWINNTTSADPALTSPGNTDDVIIPDVSPLTDYPTAPDGITLASVTLTGGTLTVGTGLTADNLTVTGAGTLNGGILTVSTSFTLNGTLNLTGTLSTATLTSTTGTVALNGGTLTVTGAGITIPDLTGTGTLNTGANNVEITALNLTGDLTLTGTGTLEIENMTVTGAGTLATGGKTVTVTDLLTLNNQLTLTGTLGINDLEADASGTAILTSGAITMNGVADVTVTAGAVTVDVDSAVSLGDIDAVSVEITTDTGFTSLALGTITSSSITLNAGGTGTIDTNGNTFNAVNIIGDATGPNTETITLGSALTVGAALTPGTLTINTYAVLDLTAYALTVNGTLDNSGTILLQGSQTVTITNYSPNPPPGNYPGGTIQYQGNTPAAWPFGNTYTNLIIDNAITVGNLASALTVHGNAEFGSAINAVSVSVGGTTDINATITTTGTAGQIYGTAIGDTVTLGGTPGDTRILAAGTGTVTVNGTIDGGTHNLTITASTAELNGGSDIGALQVTGGATFATAELSAVSVTVTGNSTISADITTTTGNQSYGTTAANTVTLGGDPVDPLDTIRTLAAGAGTVTISGAIDGTDYGLTITASTAELNGGSDIGALQVNGEATFATALLSAASVDVTGDTTINANISTTGDQSYGAAAANMVTLGGTRTLTSTEGSVTATGIVSAAAGTPGIIVNASQGIYIDNPSNTLSGNITLNNSEEGDDPLNPVTPDGDVSFRTSAAASITVTGKNPGGDFTVRSTNPTTGGIIVGALGIQASGAITLTTTSGNITVTGDIEGDAAITLTSTSGTITITGDIEGNAAVSLTADGLLTINGSITTNAGSTGVITLRSHNDGITIDAAATITGYSLALIAAAQAPPATPAVTADNIVTIDGDITVSSGGSEGLPAAVYVLAFELTASGDITFISNAASTGAVCVNTDDYPTFSGTLTDVRIHLHFLNDMHLVYGNGDNNPPIDPTGLGEPYRFIRSDVSAWFPSGFATTNKNIYLINNASTLNDREISFSTTGSGKIEIRRVYAADSLLHLNPSATGGLVLNEAEIDLDTKSFSIESTNTTITLEGDNLTSSITAASITLGDATHTLTINGTSGEENHLELTSNTISIQATTSAATPLGDFTITNNGTIDLGATSTTTLRAKSFEQIGTGTTSFGSTSSIITTGTTTGDDITFAGPIAVAGTAVLDSSAGGNISLDSTSTTPQAIDGTGTLTMIAGAGNISVAGQVGDAAAPFDGNIVVTSANDATFNAAVYAGSFTQSAGTGTTLFSATQTYNGVNAAGYAFTFAGNNLTIPNTGPNTVSLTTTTAGNGGAVRINNSGAYTQNGPVTASGSFTQAGSGTVSIGADIKVTNTTKANALIHFTGQLVLAAPVTFTAPTTGGTVQLDNGKSASNTLTLEGGEPGAASLDISCAGASTTINGDVIIAADSYVAAAAGKTIRQSDGATLTLQTPLLPDSATVLEAAIGNWYMGAAGSPPALTPGWTYGFAGFNGNIILNQGTTLSVQDFYNVAAADHTVTINGTNTAVSTVRAGGNVWINSTFANGTGTLRDSTLEMTGVNKNLTVRTDATGDPQADIGNFAVTGDTVKADIILASNVAIRGNVAIDNGTLRGGTTTPARIINVYPLDSPATGNTNIWEQINGGEFVYGTSIVEFGKAGRGASGNIYIIRGDTTWYTLACHEDSATLKFSNYVAGPNGAAGTLGHRVFGDLAISPNAPRTTAKAITLTRETDVPVPPYPDNPPYASPEEVSNHFWYFTMDPSGKMEINYIIIDHSFSSRKIPVPTVSTGEDGWYISAWPYVAISNVDDPDWSLYSSLPQIDVDGYNKAFLTYSGNRWNVNWFVFNNFFYAYTEDSNHNGKIDRVRLQSAFDLEDTSQNKDFTGFKIALSDAATGKSYSYAITGYELVQKNPDPGRAYDLNSIYVILNETDMPYDTGIRFNWAITENEILYDKLTKRTKIGNPAGGELDQDKGITWDTAPPRITYALAVPGHDEIFFQVSETLDVSGGLTVDVQGGPTGIPAEPINDREFIVPLDSVSFTSAQLAAGAINFTVKGILDAAEPAEDLSAIPKPGENRPYYFMYPPPKYPQNYNYDKAPDGVSFQSYIHVPNNSSGVPQKPAVAVPALPSPTTNAVFPQNGSYNLNSGVEADAVHRVTDLLVSVPPSDLTDPDQHAQFFVWPLWAKYDISQGPDGQLGTLNQPGYGYMGTGTGDAPFNETGIIWDFTGKRFLERDDVVMQARLSDVLSATPRLVPYFNVPDYLKSAGSYGSPGLWHSGPSTQANPPFINMAPAFIIPTPGIPTGDDEAPAAGPASPLFNYEFKKDDYKTNGTLEFFFRLIPASDFVTNPLRADLLAGRLDITAGSPIPADWYRRVRPFSFDLHDITQQRGGVTILNNVINSEKRERVFVDYKLNNSGRVTIQVFTLDGNLVKVLVRENQNASDTYYRVSWDGTNNGGRPVARGMYFIRIVAPDIDEIRKVMVVK